MNKKLIIFGDSWPWGADLTPGEKTYGQLLAEYKGWDFKNYSQFSTAPEHMILQLQEMISEALFDNTDYVALFSVSSLSRLMYFVDNPKYDKKFNTECAYIIYNGPEEGDKASESYFKYLHSNRLDHFKFFQTIYTPDIV